MRRQFRGCRPGLVHAPRPPVASRRPVGRLRGSRQCAGETHREAGGGEVRGVRERSATAGAEQLPQAIERLETQNSRWTSRARPPPCEILELAAGDFGGCARYNARLSMTAAGHAMSTGNTRLLERLFADGLITRRGAGGRAQLHGSARGERVEEAILELKALG